MQIPEEGFPGTVFKTPDFPRLFAEMDMLRVKQTPKIETLSPVNIDVTPGLGNENVFNFIREDFYRILSPEEFSAYNIATTTGTSDQRILALGRAASQKLEFYKNMFKEFASSVKTTSTQLEEMEKLLYETDYLNKENESILKRAYIGLSLLRSNRITRNEKNNFVATITEDELAEIVGHDIENFNYDEYLQKDENGKRNMLSMYFGSGVELRGGKIIIPYTEQSLLPSKESFVKNLDWQSIAEEKATKVRTFDTQLRTSKIAGFETLERKNIYDDNATRRMAMSLIYENPLLKEPVVSSKGRLIMRQMGENDPEAAVKRLYKYMKDVQDEKTRNMFPPGSGGGFGSKPTEAVPYLFEDKFPKFFSQKTEGVVFPIKMNIRGTTETGLPIRIVAVAYDPKEKKFYKKGTAEANFLNASDYEENADFFAKVAEIEWQPLSVMEQNLVRSALGLKTIEDLIQYIRSVNATKFDFLTE